MQLHSTPDQVSTGSSASSSAVVKYYHVAYQVASTPVVDVTNPGSPGGPRPPLWLAVWRRHGRPFMLPSTERAPVDDSGVALVPCIVFPCVPETMEDVSAPGVPSDVDPFSVLWPMCSPLPNLRIGVGPCNESMRRKRMGLHGGCASQPSSPTVVK